MFLYVGCVEWLWPPCTMLGIMWPTAEKQGRGRALKAGKASHTCVLLQEGTAVLPGSGSGGGKEGFVCTAGTRVSIVDVAGSQGRNLNRKSGESVLEVI